MTAVLGLRAVGRHLEVVEEVEAVYDHDVPEPTLDGVPASWERGGDSSGASGESGDDAGDARDASDSEPEEAGPAAEEGEEAAAAAGGDGRRMFDVPQRVCPGQPSRKSLGVGAPKGRHANVIKEKLMAISRSEAFLGYGGNEVRTNATCVYLTQECADPVDGRGRGVMRKLGFQVTSKIDPTPEDLAKFNKLRMNLPDLTEGSLGTCAIVANSDNLLKSRRGAEIDAHDTVFRHNTPMKGFEKHVGTKSGLVIVKSNYKGGGGGAGKAQGSGAKPSIAYMMLKNIDELPKSLLVEGKPALLRASGAHPFARLRRELYGLYGAGSRKHPSGGWARPMNVLASKLCTRVDLYGFSGNMGGKYFATSQKVRPAHAMSFEHWTYRYLQSQGKLCVYGD